MFLDSKLLNSSVLKEALNGLTSQEFELVEIRPLSIEILESFEFASEIRTVFESDARKKSIHAGKGTVAETLPNYPLLVINKWNLIMQVLTSDPFTSEYFIWVDAGKCGDAVHWHFSFPVALKMASDRYFVSTVIYTFFLI